MTPIKRGTARGLGLELPAVPQPFSPEQFNAAMADMERRMTAALRTQFLFPTHMGRPGSGRC